MSEKTKKNNTLKFILFIAGFVLMFSAAALFYKNFSSLVPDRRLAIAEGQNSSADERIMAPDFRMENSAGNSLLFSDIMSEGKPAVVNFWASWCPPCIVEMPYFESLYREIGDEINFVMLNLTDGVRETRAMAEQFIIDKNFSFPVYFDTDEEAVYTYGIRSIPTTLFIDKEGHLVTGVQGAIDEEILRMGINFIR